MTISTEGLVEYTAENPGDQVVTIEVNDGNGGLVTQTYTLVVVASDIEPPILTIISPADGLITNVANQVFSGSVNEESTMTLNNVPVPLDASFGFNVPLTLQAGVNLFDVLAVDSASNATSLQFTVILDTRLPVITITSPIDGFQTAEVARL